MIASVIQHFSPLTSMPDTLPHHTRYPGMNLDLYIKILLRVLIPNPNAITNVLADLELSGSLEGFVFHIKLANPLKRECSQPITI